MGGSRSTGGLSSRRRDVVDCCSRMGANTDSIGALVPGEHKWIVWHEPSFDPDKARSLEEKYENVRAATITMFWGTDFVVFASLQLSLFGGMT